MTMPIPRILGVLLTIGTVLSVSAGRAEDAAQRPVLDRGAYLVAFGQCNDYHTPKTPDGNFDDSRRLSGHRKGTLPEPPPSSAIYPVPSAPAPWAGMFSRDSTVWVGPWGVSFTANLTPHQTGLLDWTLDDFVKAMKEGVHKDRRSAPGQPSLQVLYPPMPWCTIGQLRDDDLAAIFAYLRSIPPIDNEVPNNIPGPNGPPQAECPRFAKSPH
jgi:hypothetical protein